MALHFSLRVNGQEIGTFYATRLDPLASPSQVSRYTVTIIREDGSDPPWSGEILHRYDDGAFELVRAALAARSAEIGGP